MSDKGMRQITMNRRTALAGLGTAAAALAMPSIVRAQSGQMVMANGGGKLDEAYRKVIFAPWKEKTGIDIVSTTNEGAKLKTMVEQGNVEWDLMQGPAEQLIVYAREGLLEPIDYSIIDKSKMVDGTMHEHFVMTDFAAYHVAWNTDNVKTGAPKNWAEMFAYDGRVGLWKRPFQTLEAALIADGVALKDLYPLDVDRAFKALDKIKSKLVWWDRGAQSAQLLLDGEVDVSATWNGRVHQPKLDGAPVDFTLDKAILVSDGWGIPKGAKNKQKSMELMALALSARAQANFAKEIPYGPVNKDAMALIDPAIKSGLPVLGDNSVMLSVDYWADNSAKVLERFNSWVLA